MKNVRSLLFVPGDRPDRFPKAAASDADALILDLEDSVSVSQKAIARDAIAAFLEKRPAKPVLVRVNPLDSDFINADLQSVLTHRPDAVVLPKCESATDIDHLVSLMGEQTVPILPIATETPASVFGLATYKSISHLLCGLTWGAEDLPAAIGAISSREETGAFTPIYEWVRAQTLLAAHAANTLAIETVYPNISDVDGLASYAARGRRDGFTAMMALHPTQCPVINVAFAPTDVELDQARKIIAAFEAEPSAGVLSIDGKMVDRPHLNQARKVLERSDRKKMER